MYVTVGFSENPEPDIAGSNAILHALKDAGRSAPCDLIMLFATALQNPMAVRAGIMRVVGDKTPIIGGSAIGAISNNRFGYAGEQVIAAAIWLEDVSFEMHAKGGLVGNEFNVGRSLGKSMLKAGNTPDTPCMLLYDAIERLDEGGMHLNLATPILQGIKQELGFLPNSLVGAGLQSDFLGSPTVQWVGSKTASQTAMILSFPGGVILDSIIMHGCRPYGDVYTVTKADGQTILEVDGEPALPYIQSRVTPRISAKEFPLFMIFGINRLTEGEFSEDYFSNRLCLDIDKDRNGIVMFEPDMVPGTRFQLMYRSLDLKYIPPRINALLEKKPGRKPVFSMYINCAGRAARYGGGDQEDAEVLQQAIGDRVPLLGIYSGVEIAPIMGKPRTLDWTGVFCLFSVPEK